MLLLVALLTAAPVTSAHAASVTASATVKITKPLELAVKRNIDFGQVLMVNVTGSATVSISQAGALTCGVGLTCSGAAQSALFNVRGSNNNVVRILVSPSNLINASDGSTIQFTPNAPASVTLTSSGAPGNDFAVGGSIAIPSTASDGTYSGTVDVTVDYQ
jgi:spore coat protein U-like protein